MFRVLVLLALVGVVFVAGLVLFAAMRSSQISQSEERHVQDE